jgi:ribonucleotide reductase alpha subunit
MTKTLLSKDKLKDPIVSENALRVLKERYLARDDDGNIIEDPKEMYIRVATAIALAEKREDQKKWAEKFYNIMASGTFLPNSPCLMNAGRQLGMLSACFVLGIEDDLESIADTQKAVMLVQRAGGGTGFDFSKLRPNGSIVRSTGGTTPGPLSFIDAYSATTTAIQQGAFRRGANMGILSVDHPDIIDFINAKQDLSRWQNYNVSVAITDDFMECLAQSPDSSHEVYHHRWGEGQLLREKSTGKVVAKKFSEPASSLYPYEPWTYKDTWNLTCVRAWATGEPGLFFVDAANKDNPIPHVGRITATNPCVTGDTMILTLDGPVSMKDLSNLGRPCKACGGGGELHTSHSFDCYDCNGTGYIGQRILLYAWDPESKLPVVRQANAPKLTKRNAEILEVEFDSGLKVRCTHNHNFRSFRGDKIKADELKIGQSVRAFSVSEHRDGHLRAHGWVANKTAHQWVARMVWEEANGQIPHDHVVHHKDGRKDNNSIHNLELMSSYDHQSEHYPTREAAGFGRHGWKTDPKEVAKKVSKTAQAKNHKVIAIRDAGKEDVYNMTVDDVHTYIICDPEYKGDGPDGVYSGIVSCNCGEQPLHDWDSCNLGSINLSKFYDPTFKVGIDFQSLADTVRITVRFLDNVIEVNNYPIPQIAEMAKKTRRIGLGVMGWADFLFKLGIPYDSEQAWALAEKMMLFISNNARAESASLAVEKGNFGAWHGSNYSDDCFSVFGPMRNSYRTTIAPTGTISIIADCSCGIEPLFGLGFTRTVMPNNDGKFVEMQEINQLFIDAVEKSNLSEKTKESMLDYAADVGSIGSFADWDSNIDGTIWEELANVFKTSHEIHPNNHVRMQAAWQKHVDSSISKTINLPHSSTVEDVDAAYRLAYDLGCKGVTVYRDGCRDNIKGMKQPMSVKKKEEKSVPPQVNTNESIFTNAVKTTLRTPFGSLHVNIVLGEDGVTPLEIFAQVGKAGDIIASDLEAICRLASLLLRRGEPLRKVIDQLEGIGSTEIMPSQHGKIVSLPDALSKVLKEYEAITSGTIKKNEEEPKRVFVAMDAAGDVATFEEKREITNYGIKCPICRAHLHFMEGCKRCTCGYSAC